MGVGVMGVPGLNVDGKINKVYDMLAPLDRILRT